MIYLVDMDGTISDISHRLHFIQQEPKDWTSFSANVEDDKPIWETISVVRALHAAGHKVLIVTGRGADTSGKTLEWLKKYRVPQDGLYMRKVGDHREDFVIKSELLDLILETHIEGSIGGVFEDRQQVVDMFRARGIRVFQVAAGKY